MAAAGGADVPVQLRLYKSLKLWSFFCDLEESLGDLASTRRVYERILELRIATPQIIINYAALLEVRPLDTSHPHWQSCVPELSCARTFLPSLRGLLSRPQERRH